MRVGISGMGRIGRLALRAAMGAAERQGEDPRAGNRLEIVHLNEINGGAPAIANLLEFDSVQGRWRAPIRAEENAAASKLQSVKRGKDARDQVRAQREAAAAAAQAAAEAASARAEAAEARREATQRAEDQVR
jgi:glyceraldehyde-3-phosphate dehydrogenase/erythrose-4-phosphate dehydrogenase